MTASAHYHRLRNSQRLLLSRDEVRWHLRVPEPAERTDVVIDFGCGLQRTPHLMVEMVDVLTALGASVTAVAGSQWCCGIPVDVPTLSAEVTRASVAHLARHEPKTVVQSCGAWWPKVATLCAEGESIPFELEHLSDFILSALRQRADSIDWCAVPHQRVLLHLKAQDVLDAGMRAERANSLGATDRSVPVILALIPSVEIAGDVQTPSPGRPCDTVDDRSVLDGLARGDRERVTAELAGQAEQAGANAIVCAHHRCYEEWGKYGTDGLPVRHYVSMLAEAMGLARSSRFHTCWSLPSIAAIVDETRPAWQSWGLARDEATALATEVFWTHS
jgi:heterodisulfide reductase subunit D